LKGRKMKAFTDKISALASGLEETKEGNEAGVQLDSDCLIWDDGAMGGALTSFLRKVSEDHKVISRKNDDSLRALTGMISGVTLDTVRLFDLDTAIAKWTKEVPGRSTVWDVERPWSGEPGISIRVQAALGLEEDLYATSAILATISSITGSKPSAGGYSPSEDLVDFAETWRFVWHAKYSVVNSLSITFRPKLHAAMKALGATLGLPGRANHVLQYSKLTCSRP
jgi:hypothetical protein